MEYSEEQLREYREEFGKRRKAQLILGGLAVAAAVLLGVFGSAWSQALAGHESILLGALFVLVLVTILFAVRNDRCPACGGMISNAWRAKFCSQCGVPLR